MHFTIETPDHEFCFDRQMVATQVGPLWVLEAMEMVELELKLELELVLAEDLAELAEMQDYLAWTKEAYLGKFQHRQKEQKRLSLHQN